MDSVIVLNSNYEFLNVISWKKAICLICNSKIEIIKYSNTIVKSIDREFKVPAIVRVINNIKNFYKKSPRFTRNNIYLRDKYTCQYCYKRFDKLTIDHVIPKSKGGKNIWTNVVTCCHKCNTIKADKSLEEVGFKLLKEPKKLSIREYFILKNKNLKNQVYDQFLKGM
jgi:5-methylcytosine-specific restriction endonuclease McrA